MESLAAAAITVAALTGLSALAFGWDTWQAFFAAAANARHVYEAGISQAGLTSPFGVVLVTRWPSRPRLPSAGGRDADGNGIGWGCLVAWFEVGRCGPPC